MKVLLLLLIVQTVMSLPANKLGITGSTTALMYLSRFGYMDPAATNPESGALLSEDSVKQAVIDFQAFAGLPQTGELTDETLEMMNMPRCGNRDIIGHGLNTRRKKRYALQGSRWKVRDLTYKISKYPSGLKEAVVDSEIEKAFKVWEKVSDLTFKRANSGKIHIDVRFEKGEHGDGDPFDGPGGTLAHAYFPIYGGDAHFDDTEVWTVDSFRGTNLFQVAAHEFGHSLGLSHSDVRSALMAPFYRGFEREFELDLDDIKAIQALYGEKTSETPASPATTRPPSRPSPPVNESPVCSDSKMDAVVTMSDKITYMFKGSQYYKLTEDSIAPGYPRSISADWNGMPGFLDAAFTWTNGRTYFFKGKRYWRFTNFTMDADYPKLISKGFSGIPDNVDAAFVWSGNGKIYFTKGSLYWRFDPTNRPPVKSNYPEMLSNWEGIPNNLDDALQYSNGYTYFFKDGTYYRFNDRSFTVDEADPPFPRPVGYWWLGCKSSASQRAAPSTRNDVPLPNDFDAGDDKFDAGDKDEGGAHISTRFSSSLYNSRDLTHYGGDNADDGHYMTADDAHYKTADDAQRGGTGRPSFGLAVTVLMPVFSTIFLL